MNPEFIEKVKDGLITIVPGVSNDLAAAVIAEGMEEATGNPGIVATGDILALMDDVPQPPSSVESYADSLDAAARETGFRASDALTTLSDAHPALNLSHHAGIKRGEMAVISSAATAASGILADSPKTMWRRGETPFLTHIDELPFIDVSGDTASRFSLMEREVPRADDLVLGEAVSPLAGQPLTAQIRSASHQLNTLMADIRKMRKHYPVVAGRVVHVKKRTSKFRAKK